MAAAMQASPGADRGPPNPRLFGAAAAEYFRLYGGGVEHLAKIGEPLPTSHRCMLIMVIRALGRRFVS
jgi:hypothetical protein